MFCYYISVHPGYGTVSMDDWCPTFQDSVVLSYSRVKMSAEKFLIGPITHWCGAISQKNRDFNCVTENTLNLTCCPTFWLFGTWVTCSRASQTHTGDLEVKFCTFSHHYCMRVIHFLFQSSLPIEKYQWHQLLEESQSCKIWGSYSSVGEDWSRLGCYTMSTGKQLT